MSEPTPPSLPAYEILPSIEVFVPRPPRQRYWLHGLLLVLTIFSTLVVGARLEYNFLANLPRFLPIPGDVSVVQMFLWWFPVNWVLDSPSRLLLGVPFAGTLMVILVAHELGHYVYCLRYGVRATLPFFIPAPTLIGTLGAFIRIKSPIRTRTALFDIGIAGPIAGFVVASITLLFSLTLSKPMPAEIGTPGVFFGYPLVFHLAHRLLVAIGIGGAGQVSVHAAYLHPTAIAAWVGMFATALNLLPGGQLDGGHIIYALVPRAHKYTSWLAVLVLLPMGVWLWEGWLLWAVLLGATGLRHPQVPQWPGVDRSRWVLGVVALLILVLTFVPIPFSIPQR